MEQRQLVQVRCEPVGQRHDDRKRHRRRADNGRADQHRLGSGLERVTCSVVLLEQVFGPIELHVEAEFALETFLDAGNLFDDRQFEDRLGIVRNRTVRVDRNRDRAHA